MANGFQFTRNYAFGKALHLRALFVAHASRKVLDAGEEGGVTHAFKVNWV